MVFTEEDLDRIHRGMYHSSEVVKLVDEVRRIRLELDEARRWVSDSIKEGIPIPLRGRE